MANNRLRIIEIQVIKRIRVSKSGKSIKVWMSLGTTIEFVYLIVKYDKGGYR